MLKYIKKIGDDCMSRDNTPTLQLKMFWHDITDLLNVCVCLFSGNFILCSNQDEKI